jgi:signal transduction histidine kinase
MPAGLVLVVIVVLGVFFQMRSTSVMESHIRNQLRTAASIGALQFTFNEIDAIHGPKDMSKPVFHQLVQKLDDIRTRVPNAKFAYIFRKTDKENVLSFVADADSNKSLEALDLNKNGSVDSDEEPGFPGEQYDISAIPLLENEAFLGAVASDVYTDQWGSLLSGFAPIVDENGNTVAILGIDMDAKEYMMIAQSVLSPLLLLLVFVVGVLMTSYIGIFVWRRRLENMRELDRERSRLMDLTLHQIGTPLSGMHWWVEILHDEATKYPDMEKHEAFEHLNIGMSRMTEVIEALAKASKLRRKELELHAESLLLKQNFEETIKAFQNELTYREQAVELTIDPSLSVHFDRSLLSEVTQSLLKNAMYYSPARSRIFVHAEAKEGKTEVSIRDEGYGISSEDLEGIFKEMRRGKDAYKSQPVGNGLGLYITKGIIERGGGDMWIESQKGKGTTVHFTLPLA